MANSYILALQTQYRSKVLGLRIALTLAYDGNAFFGSQQQSQTPNTVLGVLTTTFLQLGITYKPVASGRTDRGVHATAQVVHVDLPPHWTELQKLTYTLNKILPPTLRVRKIIQVSDLFHARYCATMRTYRYILRQGEPNPFLNNFITFVQDINTQKLAENITLFEGENDFSCFMKSGSQTVSTRRTIYKTALHQHHNCTILTFSANGFLRAQIRMMVGALLQLEADQITQRLQGKCHAPLKPAPPNGLYLTKILYPKKLLLSDFGSPI